MGLAEIQRILAQLYTNTDLRERFLADPQGTGREMGLSPDDIHYIMQISSQQLTFFANSLHNKRLGEVRKLLPFSYRLLDRQFTQLFHQFANTYLPAGIKKHRDDAIHFADFLIHTTYEKSPAPAWVREVIRYEQALLLASEATRHLIIRRFHYRIDQVVARLARGETHFAPACKTTIMLWLRLSAKSDLHYFAITLPL